MKATETPNWLKNEDVHENYIALFIVDFKPYDTLQIGIWEATAQPVLIREEIDGHYVSHYSLIKNLSFEAVRNYAKECTRVVSTSARHFLDIDEMNWKTRFHIALGGEEKEFNGVRYSFLTGMDVRYNIGKR